MHTVLDHRLIRALARVCLAAAATLLLALTAQALPILVISDASIAEGNSGSRILVMQVNFAGAQPNTVTGLVTAMPLSGLGFNAATGAATCGAAGVDFEQFTNVPFTIPPNTPNGTLSVNVRICGDARIEPNEHIFVALTNVTGAQCLEGTCNGVGTIVNDDGPPSMSINNISVSEPVFGTKSASFTVSLSHAHTQDVGVSFATRNGTARATCQLCVPAVILGDYVGRSSSLVIPAGSTTASIAITINSRVSNEPDEDFFVDLSSPVNATIADGSGRAVIRDTTLSTGGFDLSPADAQVRLGERLNYTLDWTVPANEVWRNLTSIDLRLRGAHDTALWLRWDEASNLISLCQRASNRGGRNDDDEPPSQAAVCSAGALPGSGTVLATPLALLHLGSSSVTGSGPQGQQVRLVLAITLIGKAAGHDYKLELAAADDFGNRDRFTRAGAVSVQRADRH